MSLKINQETAQKIIDLYVLGHESKDLGIKFSIKPKYIWAIVSGTCWKQCYRPENIKTITQGRKKLILKGWSDKLHVQYPPLTLNQKEVINGALLGDGCLTKFNDLRLNSRFTFTQCVAHKEYVEGIRNHLSAFCQPIKQVFSNKKLKNSGALRVSETVQRYLLGYRVDTCSHPIFTDLRKKWYPKGKKIIPRDLKLTPQSLAIWFCDDGSNDINTRTAVLATNGFTFEDVEFLCGQLLDNLNIHATINVHNCDNEEKQPIIRIAAKSYETLIKTIKPFVPWKCLSRKIEYRDATPRYLINAKLTEYIVLEIMQLKGKYTQREIAQIFGVSKYCVHCIFTGKTWKHITQIGAKYVSNREKRK